MNDINKNNRNLIKIKKEINKLIKKEKFFSNAILSIYEFGFSIVYEKKIIFCNEKYAEILGYERDEIIGENFFDFIVPEQREIWEKRIIEKSDLTFECGCLKKDGSEIFVRINIKCIRYKDFILKFIILNDVTNEKLNIKKIKDFEENYKILSETLLDGVIILDKKGRFIFANDISANILGFNKGKDLIGKNFFDFLIDREKFENDLKVIEQGKSGYFIEHEIIDTRGLKLSIETIGRKTNYQDEEGFLISFRDITDRKIMIENLKKAIEKNKRILDQTVIALSEMVGQKDPYTAIHQKRVAKLSVAIAKGMGFKGDLIEGIKISGLIHDIGKIYIPSDILSKPGKLTDIEWEFIKLHPEFGAKIVKNIEFPYEIEKIILQHHERIDGSGYPKKIKGENILLEAKIISVADSIESMIFHRPYKEKKSLKEALEEIENKSGKLYEPEVVNVVLKIFEKGFNFEDC
ncbi:MAG: PAS domain S-box protein [Candidatus Omnitrophica bacterium]|nr:PAS domain S-box protein [Candidatus Omnitrophota bacterium]MCM8801994.1 PAS domain S-box protein [Candidatus Omnitrophota bacterium]